MNPSKRPIWKKSMLEGLGFDNVIEDLLNMSENGDVYGYDRDEEGYYQEYKPLFDDLADGAYRLYEAIAEWELLIRDHWDDATVGLLGETITVLGYDVVEHDYYGMLSYEENLAQNEALKRLERLSKRDLISLFRRVLVVLMSYADLKCAHDCLCSIVQELDERGAIMEKANKAIETLYADLTGAHVKQLDEIVRSVPPRMWVE